MGIHKAPKHLARRTAAALFTGALAATFLTSTLGPAQAAGNPATPGNFTGFGFDQCEAPSQSAMDAWWKASPFSAVGIYIAGTSRGCRTQAHLTSTWVHNQQSRGWRLLPITLGPQASCNPRYPRYGNDPRIPATATNQYAKAKAMGGRQANATVAAARRLGIAGGSTMFYDLESFDISKKACRDSAMWFVSAFAHRVHVLGYRAGYYSSASTGIKAMYAVKHANPRGFVYPDQIWIGDWNGAAGVSTRYIPNSAWSPHRRVKQYQGGHNETYGGVKINIDRDYLDVGKGSVAGTVRHCGGVNVNFTSYATIKPPTSSYKPPAAQVTALKCMLKERGSFTGIINGTYGSGLRSAIVRWRADHHLSASTTFDPKAWRTLWAKNHHPILKRGSAGESVRDLQRALDATGQSQKARISGVLDWNTHEALLAYQKRLHRTQNGMATAVTWSDLAAGR